MRTIERGAPLDSPFRLLWQQQRQRLAYRSPLNTLPNLACSESPRRGRRSGAFVPWRGRQAPLVVTILVSCLLGLYLLTGIGITIKQSPGLTAANKQMFASHAVNNTVMIVPVNTGMLHWAENLNCSLAQIAFNTSRLVFWTLDEGAQSLLSQRGLATYRDPTLFSTSNNENLRGDTAAYKRMMQERPKFFINILSAGFDILMLDADTVFWQSPLQFMPDPLSKNIDIVFSTDAREFYQFHNAFADERRRGLLMPPICNGIFWMRSSENTIALWTEMLAVFNSSWPWRWFRMRLFQDDQRGMDVLLNDGRAEVVEPYPDGITADMVPRAPTEKHRVNVRLLDQTQVVNGHLLKNRRSQYGANLARLRARGQDRIAAHFNWDTTELTKEEGSTMYGMYLLDSNGGCRTEISTS